MADNIFKGPNGRQALVDFEFEGSIFDTPDCLRIYGVVINFDEETDEEIDRTYGSWEPGRPNNAITSAVAGETYIFIMVDDPEFALDASELVGPPLVAPIYTVLTGDYVTGLPLEHATVSDDGVDFVTTGGVFGRARTTLHIPSGVQGYVMMGMEQTGTASMILDTVPDGTAQPANEGTPLEINGNLTNGRVSGKNYSNTHAGGTTYPYNFYNTADQTGSATFRMRILLLSSTVKFQYTLNVGSDPDTATWIDLTAANDGVTNTCPRPSGNLYLRFFAFSGSAHAYINKPKGKGLVPN
ncbi:hypothetical protein [Hufsiella ginkgonis]|uniref:Uncharacterized protein n=1 Tax=Hufsiella ginkgonis TaxID=2695274 RepID=A0A7K1Y0Q4_9SPHI|nr:hypothetical protein [Hufsiella ginkgonis]MXV16823.1 hypothetical protein [Hufsiella ginkgonis]